MSKIDWPNKEALFWSIFTTFFFLSPRPDRCSRLGSSSLYLRYVPHQFLLQQPITYVLPVVTQTITMQIFNITVYHTLASLHLQIFIQHQYTTIIQRFLGILNSEYGNSENGKLQENFFSRFGRINVLCKSDEPAVKSEIRCSTGPFSNRCKFQFIFH